MAKPKAKARAKTASRKASRKRKQAPRKKVACAKCKKKTCDQLYEKHKKEVEKAKTNDKFKGDIAAFKKHYEANKAKYESVAEQTNVPAPLIAALHWRESSGNFGTYLHQGDPLGKPPVNVPTNIPTFGKDEWDKAAAHAINQKKACRDALGMDKNTKDRAKMAAYAERYNGLGYDGKGVPSPYVYSGTDNYSAGKYIRDHVYSSTAVDKQVGVLPLVDAVSP